MLVNSQVSLVSLDSLVFLDSFVGLDSLVSLVSLVSCLRLWSGARFTFILSKAARIKHEPNHSSTTHFDY